MYLLLVYTSDTKNGSVFIFCGGGVALGGRCSALVLEHADSVVVVRGLTYPSVCRILVPHM